MGIDDFGVGVCEVRERIVWREGNVGVVDWEGWVGSDEKERIGRRWRID